MFIRNKKAESSIGTAIAVVISVVLGGLVLVGAMTDRYNDRTKYG